ncbi:MULTISPECIES: DUF4282 domain-containing protein [unclassified Thioalkalivibrio]|uniref:DUF4282 domain-containing protein n=1 Tax=unclassified Thioalkalivibrio TaxID=2621013 RepID=UPI000377325B|nr:MULTISPECIES: DUF4282 domain-containing protein [unclassified Thioalkalivibrio]
MRDFLFFDTMLTPKIITIVYWLLLLVVVVSGLGAMFSGSGLMGLLIGLAILVFGAIGARVWSELLIVIFKINENTKKMADKA